MKIRYGVRGDRFIKNNLFFVNQFKVNWLSAQVYFRGDAYVEWDNFFICPKK